MSIAILPLSGGDDHGPGYQCLARYPRQRPQACRSFRSPPLSSVQARFAHYLSCRLAELVPQARNRDELDGWLRQGRIQVVPFTADHAYTAGVAHVAYRQAGGKRQRILADFLMGPRLPRSGPAGDP